MGAIRSLIAAVVAFLAMAGLLAACGGGSSNPSNLPPPPSTGSATLTWTLPTQNTDGSPLTDLAGFRIMFGQSPTALDQSVTVNSPTATSYTVGNLDSGTWYFAIVAFDSLGGASAPTNLVTATI